MKPGRIRNVTNQTETQTTEDGEIKNEVSSNTVGYEAEPPFVKLYFQDIAKLKKLSPLTSDLLLELTKYMNYRNEIVLVKYIKQQICDGLGTTMNGFEHAFKKLRKKELIMRVAESCYIVDPCIFGKGSWKEIKSLRLVVDYHRDGTRSLKASQEKKKKKEELGLQEIPFKEFQEGKNDIELPQENIPAGSEINKGGAIEYYDNKGDRVVGSKLTLMKQKNMLGGWDIIDRQTSEIVGNCED
jgi:hypothetical protein